MEYTYSIIIPHYNISDLLERLLKSIPQRDDLQVIVVDDCSNEDTLKQLSKIQSDYPKTEFYSTAVNNGGGRARNIGLKYAKGKYVIFADADDFFTPEFSEILSSYADNEDIDVIYFNNTSVDSETLEVSHRDNQLTTFFNLAEKSPEKGEKAFRFIFGEPWCKIIRRKLIEKNKIHFDETPIHNDTKLSYMVGFLSGKIKLDSRVGYCITSRSHSVSKDLSDEKYIIRERVFCEKMRFYKDNSIEIIDPLVFTPLIHALKIGKFGLLKNLLKEFTFINCMLVLNHK